MRAGPLGGIACAFLGHRWSTDKDVHDVNATLKCGRCGRRQILNAEQRTIQGLGRGRRVRR